MGSNFILSLSSLKIPLQVAACRTPFVGQVAGASRSSTFTGAKISAKDMRTASRKSAVAAQAKVRFSSHAHGLRKMHI